MSDMSKEEIIRILQTEQAYANERYATDTYRYYRVDKAYDKAIASIENQKTGYWIGKPIAGRGTVRCSNCSHHFYENAGLWMYCPDCGARMVDKNG